MFLSSNLLEIVKPPATGGTPLQMMSGREGDNAVGFEDFLSRETKNQVFDQDSSRVSKIDDHRVENESSQRVNDSEHSREEEIPSDTPRREIVDESSSSKPDAALSEKSSNETDSASRPENSAVANSSDETHSPMTDEGLQSVKELLLSGEVGDYSDKEIDAIIQALAAGQNLTESIAGAPKLLNAISHAGVDASSSAESNSALKEWLKNAAQGRSVGAQAQDVEMGLADKRGPGLLNNSSDSSMQKGSGQNASTNLLIQTSDMDAASHIKPSVDKNFMTALSSEIISGAQDKSQLTSPVSKTVVADGIQQELSGASLAKDAQQNRAALSLKQSVSEAYNSRGAVEKNIASQIIEKFSIKGAGSHKEIFIKLDPPSLGSLRMNIQTNGENVKTTIVAENQLVKQTIESNLSQLRDSMASQGIRVDQFSVLVGGNQGNQQSRQFFGQADQSGGAKFENSDESETLMEISSPVFFEDNQSFSFFA